MSNRFLPPSSSDEYRECWLCTRKYHYLRLSVDGVCAACGGVPIEYEDECLACGKLYDTSLCTWRHRVCPTCNEIWMRFCGE